MKLPSQTEFEALIAKFKTATDNIAARIQRLKTVIAGMGLTGDQEATLFAALDVEASRATELGADSDNPVPPEPVV